MKWFQNSYRRHLCDMHIEDWDDRFLSEFSIEEYLRLLKLAKVQTAMLYCQSHVGYCLWPTKSGYLHRAFANEPDKMRKLIDNCRNEGIRVVGYYSLNYNNWAHDKYPEWRMINEDGKSDREAERCRYGLCCPNNPDYREFVYEQIAEMAEYFTFDGVFYDMPFWPHRCYCNHCRQRWESEFGTPLPKSQSDPLWDAFMTKRQDWMGEWSQAVTDKTRILMPDVSIEQNFASAVADKEGFSCVGNAINDACDYSGGDLYGGYLEQSFACKYYANVTHNQPFEYMTCRCSIGLARHTLTKSEDQLELATMLTCANHGATLLIDAIDPVGTLDERVYSTIGKIFEKESKYEPYLVGSLCADVGIYFSLKAKFNMQGQNFSNMSGAVNTFKTMVKYHIPTAIATEYQQNAFEKYQVLIAPNLNHTAPETTEQMIKYVENGGILYLSNADESALLSTIAGAKCVGYTEESIVYLAPKKEYEAVCDGFSQKYPIQFTCSSPIVEGIPEEYVLATLTLPYTTQREQRFASIHSNPPRENTTQIPALAIIPYGKGKFIWSALPIENEAVANYRRILKNVLEYAGLKPTLKTDAPQSVEILVFENDNTLQVNAVHLTEEEEAVTIAPFDISIKCDKKVKRVVLLPSKEEISFKQENEILTFTTRQLRIFDMYEIELNN